jgi:hypothetical protein
MRSVAVVEEGLEEEADKPVCKKEYKDCHLLLIVFFAKAVVFANNPDP